MSRLALWITRHWPFSCYNRIAWPIFLWLIGVGGPAFVREIYPGVNFARPQQTSEAK